LDSWFPAQPPDAVAATEILTHRLEQLTGRVGRLETDKRGSRNADIHVTDVLQQVAALEDEVRGMHRTYEDDSPAVTQQHNNVSGKLSKHMDVLEYKSSGMTRVMKLLAQQACIVSAANAAHGRAHALAQDATAELSQLVTGLEITGFDELCSNGSSLQFEAAHHDRRTAEEASMSQPTLDEASIPVLGDSTSQQQVFFDAQRRLKGRVRRLVKQFGGTCKEEEAAETGCESNRSALSVVTGVDESSGPMSSRSDATTRGRTTMPTSAALFDNQPWQQQQSQQRLESDTTTPRGCVDSTQPVSSRDSVPRWCSP